MADTTDIKIELILPYLRVRGAAKAIEFYTQVFGAVEKFRLCEPGSTRIGHAELQIGSTVIMLSDEYPEMEIHGPEKFGGTGMSLHVNVSNVDALFDRAIAAGAKAIMPPKDQFYGERSAKFADPFGHEWYLGQHIEDVTPAEMQKRWDAMMKG